jgi:ornithine carbamoyltransferase
MSLTPPVPVRHYLQFTDLTADEYAHVFARAAEIKRKFKAYEKYHPLADRTLAMIFEKASTRTRVSFEAGMYQLGGSVVHLTTGDSQLGRSEPIEDSARVISRMTDIVMIRTYGQDKIERFASHSRVPVINGLTNEFHPCQILADLFTLLEHRGLDAQGQHGQHLAAGGRIAGLYGAPEHAQRLRSRPRRGRFAQHRQLQNLQRPRRRLPRR